ncbi:MAG: hypothetical protein IT532_15985 [Burkholderiales bacterium]|nr:hypothetical protein [Burkholderiales bacterium]
MSTLTKLAIVGLTGLVLAFALARYTSQQQKPDTGAVSAIAATREG